MKMKRNYLKEEIQIQIQINFNIHCFKALITYVGSFRVSRGDIYTKALDDLTSNVYKEKIKKYKQLIEAVYQRSEFGPSLKKCHIHGFANSTLIVNFTLLLNTSLIPK